MNTTISQIPWRVLSLLLLWTALFCQPTVVVQGQEAPAFALIQPQTNAEMRLKVTGAKGSTYRIDAGLDVECWAKIERGDAEEGGSGEL